MGLITIGVDIGKKRDPTAIAVADGEMRFVDGKMRAHYTIRELGRLPLGTPYHRTAWAVKEVVMNARKRGKIVHWTCSRTGSVFGKIFFGINTRRKKGCSSIKADPVIFTRPTVDVALRL